MTIYQLIDLANGSGGTLYVMFLLLLIALSVIVERSRHLAAMQKKGDMLIAAYKSSTVADNGTSEKLLQTPGFAALPHAHLFKVLRHEPAVTDRSSLEGHLEEAIMHEVPLLDRGMWLLDTVITLAPLLGLFGTIIGMFNAFHVLGDAQNGAAQVTGGIAEALIATASGLLIAMIGLMFFNALHTRVRIVLHQLETLQCMMVNRHDAARTQGVRARPEVELVRQAARG